MYKRQPELRFATAAEFRTQVEAAVRPPASSQPPEKRKSGCIRLLIIAGVIVLALFGLMIGIYLASRAAESSAATRQAAADVVEGRTRTFTLHHTFAADIIGGGLDAIIRDGTGSVARPTADNLQIMVTAPADIMKRVQTFILSLIHI